MSNSLIDELITKIDKINPKDSEIVVLHFNLNTYDIETVRSIFENLKVKFTKNDIVAIPDDMSLSVFNPEELINVLQNTIENLLKEIN